MPNWIVVGTDIETGETQSLVIEGISKAHAEVLALKRGMRVENVEPDQLCPGDDSRLNSINFVDPTDPDDAPKDTLELPDESFTLPAWFTCRRCKQAKTIGLLLIIGGVAAYFAHMPHELYALAAAIGGLMYIGAWIARKFNMIRLVPLPQQA